MATEIAILAASDFTSSFWLGLAGVVAGLATAVSAAYFSYRNSVKLSEANARLQLDLKKEDEAAKRREGRRTEKLEAVHEFCSSCDAYWHMGNDLWNRIKYSQPTLSYREETASVTQRLTSSKTRLDLVAGEEFREAAKAWQSELVAWSTYVYEKKDWRTLDWALYKALMDRGRVELNYLET
ncbi:hypothetical protein ACWCYZ_43385 [Streptomyces virginiae]